MENERASKRARTHEESDARARAAALLKARGDGALANGAEGRAEANNAALDAAQPHVVTAATHEGAGAGHSSEWADDTLAHESVPFAPPAEPDDQNFDHTLAMDELDWEYKGVATALPPGWAKCPNSGSPVFGGDTSLGYIFAVKAPYGGPRGRRIPKAYQWSPSDLVTWTEDSLGRALGLVVQLTFSDKYYDPKTEFAPSSERLPVQHLWVKLRGHGELPSAKDVNAFVFQLLHHLQSNAGGEDQGGAPVAGVPLRLLRAKQHLLQAGPFAVAVHCTHGFNRSGFMISHYVKRLFPNVPVAECVRRFAESRPPGIYKDEYIQALFEYYHEERIEFGPDAVEVPLMPTWKPDTGSPEHFALGPDNGAVEAAQMKHDDSFGEEVHPDESAMWQSAVTEEIRDRYVALLKADVDASSRGASTLSGLDAKLLVREVQKQQRLAERSRHHFPGSQPVSLAGSNQGLVGLRRYWFTWKADGTRYLLYVAHSGTYLIDRRMRVSRCQMRFPQWHRRALVARAREVAGQDAQRFEAEYERAFFDAFDRGRLGDKKMLPDPALQHGTLLDGELVVDVDRDGRRERVFYAYDLVALHGFNVLHRPWKERWMLINEVTEPRAFEAALIADSAKKWRHRYKYASEPFRVVRKDFWPLHCVRNVLKEHIPKLKHDNDGLILQGYLSQYVPDACEDILKWKPASHNSVDFMLLDVKHSSVQTSKAAVDAAAAGQRWFLAVAERSRLTLAFDLDAQLEATDTPARFRFAPGFDGDERDLVGVVVECNFVDGVWTFMRERSKDKSMPNAIGTYKAVVQSIRDAIEEQDILEEFDLAYENNLGSVYDKDKAKRDHEAQARSQRNGARGPAHQQMPP